MALVVAVCAGGLQVATGASTAVALGGARPTEPVDELVAVHGGRLHVRCVGSGPTTVLLIAGFEDPGGNWGAIEPALSEQARVCSYDRFGNGTSEAPPRDQTFRSQAVDLHRLLRTIEEPGPYVVVGHSFGGAEAVTFAKLYAKDVRGLLLLDASPTRWNRALCSVPDNGSETARGFQELCASVADPAENSERLDGPAAFAGVAKIRSLGRLPMIVATAAEHPYPELEPEAQARLDELWGRGQDHWASLSSRAELVTVPDTGHLIQLDQPQVVIEQVQQLLP